MFLVLCLATKMRISFILILVADETCLMAYLVFFRVWLTSHPSLFIGQPMAGGCSVGGGEFFGPRKMCLC